MDFDESVEMKLCELLADRPADLCELSIAIRKQIRQASTDASELIYKTYAVSDVFSYSHRLKEAFIHIATYSEHVNLGFNYGKELPDPEGLLKGTGKLIRHIRIDSISDLESLAVQKLIASAIELGRDMADSNGTSKPQAMIDKS